jgi:hypothetical protein
MDKLRKRVIGIMGRFSPPGKPGKDSALRLNGFRVLAVIESGRVQLIRATGTSSLYSPILLITSLPVYQVPS